MDDEDGKHLADTIRILQQVQDWEARTNADAPRLRPAPRSPLRGDDYKAHPYDLSSEAWRHLSTAVDHLSCLRAVLEDANVVHMYAPFTLVRGALENACGAVWLLQPSQRTERLARGLRLALSDVRHSEDVKQLTGNALCGRGRQTVRRAHGYLRLGLPVAYGRGDGVAAGAGHGRRRN
jgi:hypothetical protein